MRQVVGALTAHNYAMIIRNFAPRTTLTFNVHANPEQRQPWGTWSVNRRPRNSDRHERATAAVVPGSSDREMHAYEHEL